MDERSLLDAVTRRYDMLTAAWNVYLLAAAGVTLLALLAPAAVRARRGVVAGGFAFFALTHLLNLLFVLKQWRVLAEELAARRPDLAERFANAGILDAPDGGWVLPFHLAADVFVIGVVWRTGRRAASAASSRTGSVSARVPSG